jgi:hypothetical protein
MSGWGLGIGNWKMGIGLHQKLFTISQFLIPILLLGGCSSFVAEEPPSSDSTMVEVLIELHLARARQNIQQDLSPAVRDDILKAYGLSEEQFRENMARYAEHPEAFVDLYTRMMDRLAAERSTVEPPAMDKGLDVLSDSLGN